MKVKPFPLPIYRAFASCFLAVPFFLAFALSALSAQTLLVEGGKALFPIVVPPGASETTRQNAQILAEYLKKITGVEPGVEEGDGSRGIALGPATEFTALPTKPQFEPTDPLRTEEYLLHSHPQGLLLVGATDLGAQDAMWDFLGRLGYRQYFPGPVWEVIPSVPRLEVDFDEVQKPDFLMRSVWMPVLHKGRGELIQDWQRKNRMVSGVTIMAGHSYERIIGGNKAFFSEHPDYLFEGKKPRLWRPEVRQFFVEQYLKQAWDEKGPHSISVDPSDGGGWDEGPESKAFGSISDQVITLANESVEALRQEFSEIQVGLYAYNNYSEPPTIRVSSGVNVLVTTWFRTTSLSLEDQMMGWAKQGATIGIRDYISFAAMDYDLPSRSRGIRSLTQFARNLRNYHSWNARFYSAQAMDNWGINGLLYYSLPRILWNLDDPINSESVLEEFLSKCFGPVKEAIRPFYSTLEQRPVPDEDLVNRLYSAITDARSKTDDPALLERLNDLTLYTRYIELYNCFAGAVGEGKRRAAVEQLSTHLFRAGMRSVNSARGIIKDIFKRDPGLRTQEEAASLRAGIPPWSANARPYTSEETVAMVTEGLKNNARLPFEIISYSDDLVPARALFPEAAASASTSGNLLAYKTGLYFTWADEAQSDWTIRITNPRQEVFRVDLKLWAKEEALDEPVAAQDVQIAPGQTAEISLSSPHKGLHWLFLSGLSLGDGLELDPKKMWTVSSSPNAAMQTLAHMRMVDLFFYVPKGTKQIGGRIAKGAGWIVNPEGELAADLDGAQIVQVEVPQGMDGKLWQIKIWRGNLALLTVPPYFAPSPDSLLLPREVVEASAPTTGN